MNVPGPAKEDEDEDEDEEKRTSNKKTRCGRKLKAPRHLHRMIRINLEWQVPGKGLNREASRWLEQIALGVRNAQLLELFRARSDEFEM